MAREAMMIEHTQDEWIILGALCEFISISLRLPTTELAEVLSSGEFIETIKEIGEQAGLGCIQLAHIDVLLAEYKGQNSEELFHSLRTEYTRLLVGTPVPVVSPYAGVWHAKDQGVEPLLFINPHTMEIERFMRKHGIGQAEGKNEPLDHIASEFEFLQYLALVNASAVEVCSVVEIPEAAFSTFFFQYVSNWASKFANEVLATTKLGFYKAAAEILIAMLHTEQVH